MTRFPSRIRLASNRMVGLAVLDPVVEWTNAMRRGDFESAWRVSDRVIARRSRDTASESLPRHLQRVWMGEPLEARRVLVRCYHGLGDTLQFARFVPRLTGLARETIVWAQPWLIPLLATIDGIGRLLPLHDGDPGVEFDVDVEIMELAHVFRISKDTVGDSVPYLRVPPAPRLSDRFSIGIVAQAGGWDHRRSIDPSLLHFPSRDVALFNLQRDEPLPGMPDASTDDALELAARLQSLDLVVSVDTMMAHLAGALAVPVWLLLPADADWRWMTDRRDSPWYPTMRLFRQPSPGAWGPVMPRLQAALCAR